MVFKVGYATGNYSGTGGIVQLLTADYSARPDLTFSDWRLDGNNALYSSGTISPLDRPPLTTVAFDDEPQNYQSFIFSRIWIIASFKDYCVFRPNDGDAQQNIFVTLGLISWSCHGELAPTHFGQPGYPNPQVVVDNVTGPDGPVATDEFPTWLNTCSE